MLHFLKKKKKHQKKHFRDVPKSFTIGLCTIAPFSGYSLLNLNLPFTLSLKEVRGCFLMSGVRMLHFLRMSRLMEIHSNPPILYTMAWDAPESLTVCYNVQNISRLIHLTRFCSISSS